MSINIYARGNISKILLQRSSETPEHKAFVFIDDHGQEESVSYRDMHRRSSSVALAVRSMAEPGSRALLLCPTSSEFIAGFFGCLYAGVVPIPASPPSRRTQHRLMSMISDCDPDFVITTRRFSETFEGKLRTDANLKNPKTIFMDDLSRVEDFEPHEVDLDQLAFLQYTSGSTDRPKGVMVTHGNLWHNLDRIRSSFHAQEGSMSVSWLPLFHDMGLIGQMIGAVYTGVGSVLMQPSSFLRAPLSWVENISKYRAFCAGGPNFAYELCVQAALERKPQDLDLSNWQVAFSGAEPVRSGTLKRFAECFAPYGFQYDSFLPVYGLAESTLLVASGKRASRVETMYLDPLELESNRAVAVEPQRGDARPIICCGTPDDSERIEIVDPEKRSRVAKGCIGEIWVSSPSIAAGYWCNPQASQETFMAQLNEDSSRVYCRTGDLGYMHQDSLYITGRLKDLIIIRGRNHYPNDIESTTATCHTAIEASGVAAIGVLVEEEERLVVLAEIGRSSRGIVDLDQVATAIRKAVYESHGLSIHEVCLLQLGQLPRTSSGKIQRHACRISYLDKSLKPASTKTKTASTQETPQETAPIPQPAQVSATRDTSSSQRADEMIDWLRDYSQERINSRLIDERRCIPPYIVLDFGNRGLLGMVTAEEFGGQGILISDSMRVIEQLAAIDLTLASFVGIQHALGIHPIEHHAQREIRQRWLPELARGRQLAAFAITEPIAGSNPNALISKALPDGENRWRLHGQKSWIGTAAWAGVINVFARQYDTAGNHIGVSGFVVPQERKGLRMGPEALTMGVRGMVQNSVLLNAVEVHASDILGDQGRGMQVAHEAMMLGRLGICAMSIGGMKRCAQLMMRYAQRRSIATGLLADNLLTQQRLSELAFRIASVENLVQAIGQSLDAQEKVPAEAFAVCKVVGPEFLATATDQLMQMLGGRGYIETNMVPQMLRDARLLRIFEGPTETLLAFLGSQSMVGSQSLNLFLKEVLEAPQVANAFQDALQTLQQLPSDGSNRYNVAFSAGKLAAQATLWGAACWGLQYRPEKQLQNILPWAKSRFEQTLKEILSQDDIVFTTPELFKNIEAYQSSIGQVDQAMAGEDSQVDAWLAKEFQAVEISKSQDLWHAPSMQPMQSEKEVSYVEPTSLEKISDAPSRIDTQSVEQWIIDWLIEKLKVNPKTIRLNQPISQFGLDSVIAVKLILDMEKKFQRQVSIEQFWETPTIESLARWVAGRIENPATPSRLSPGVHAHMPTKQTAAGIDLSVFFFSSPDPSERTDKYQLVLEASKFADKSGFKAVWVPERHFHPFGGLYPNPSTLAAAIAMVTKRIRIRSGSVVLPLHDPIRVAEEWSLVDNLSGGRVDLSFTKGWNPDDFVFYPERFEDRQKWLENNLDHVRKLWRGETIQRVNGLGKSWDQGIYPRPVQKELPVWLTCNTSREGFQWAGTNGLHLLTALLGQSLEELSANIAIYRRAREHAGHDPQAGHVTLMLHTFVGHSNEQVRQTVREPLRGYLQDSMHLWAKNVKPLKELSEKEKNKSLDYAFERYYRSSALMGDLDACLKMIDRVKRAGVNEIACLIDFGVDKQAVLESLKLVGSMIDQDSVNARSTALKPTRKMPQERSRLSLQQLSLWVHYKLNPRSAAYNQALALRVEGPIEIQWAQRAFQEAIAKEPILTSCFYEDDQGVWRKSLESNFPQQFVESLNAEQSVEDWLDLRIQEPFDLYSGPPIRVYWLSLAPEDHMILIVNHHIVADARAMALLVRRGFDIYHQASSGQTRNDSAPTETTYEEFVEQQYAWLSSPQAKEQIAYWQQKLSGTLPPLELPFRCAEKTTRLNKGFTTSGTLGKEATKRLTFIAKEFETSPARLLLAIFSLWLHRITGQDTLVTGLASHGLPDSSYANVIGHFVNPLPIRSDYESNLKFKDWVNRIDETVSQAFVASRCTFAKIVEAVRPERVPDRSPIFQTLFNFLSGDIAVTKSESYPSGNLLLKPIHLKQQEGQFDLNVEFIEKADDMIFDLKVATDVFDASTAERFRAGLLHLIHQTLLKPDSAISQFELVTRNDRIQLDQWNSTECDISEHPLAFELFEEQAALTPDSIALTFGDQSMRYQDLDTAANQLAHHLRSLGARPDAPIGIYMNRSIDLVIAVLAIMKSGSAFLPLNVDDPWVRTQTILGDARPILVITVECFQDRWVDHPTTTLFLDRDQAIIKRYPNSDLESVSQPSDLVYIMYTSGSTGQPKGVQIEHRNLINFLASMRREPGISPSDIVLAVTPLTFDISILELLLPLCVGARIVIASRQQATDAQRLAKLLSDSGATWMQATPSHWRMLIESDWQPTGDVIALCGGEVMTGEIAEKLLARCKAVWNMYGPTETTIWSSIYRVRQIAPSIPIGQPILNTELLVLDKQMRMCPIGTPGELYIAGAGVARGYLNRPELTAEKFVDHPTKPHSGLKAYRTGDEARWSPQGLLEYLGRTDNQVKIRGHRIEPEEIEAVLASHPMVKQAVVIPQDDSSNNRRLVAHLCLHDSSIENPNREFRKFVSELLPDYMIPASFVTHTNIPLTPHGKIDLKSLLQVSPMSTASESASESPRNKLEHEICTIWAEVLGVRNVGIHDNYFELGGDSLLAMKLILRLSKALSMEITVADLFQGQTVAQMAQALSRQSRVNWHEEMKLPKDFRLLPHRSARSLDQRQVLLTGATGFIGSHILRDLLAQTHDNIVCLVKERDAETAMDRIDACFTNYDFKSSVDRKRVKIVCGNLSKEGLGLDLETWNKLSEQIDLIVHAGAWVNFAFPYQALRPVNVQGTIEVLRLMCQANPKSLVFLSSLTALDDSKTFSKNPPTELDGPGNPENLATGYAQTKAISERLLEQATKLGLDITRLRIGLISGASTSGAWSDDQWLPQALRASAMIRKFPIEFADKTLRLMPVDYASNAIVRLLSQGVNRPEVIHLDGKSIGFEEIIDRLPGGKPDLVTFSDWLQMLQQSRERFEPGVIDGLLAILSNPNEFISPILPDISTAKSRAFLESIGIQELRLESHLIDRYWKRLLGTHPS